MNEVLSTIVQFCSDELLITCELLNSKGYEIRSKRKNEEIKQNKNNRKLG
jgi:hypothetical protein